MFRLRTRLISFAIGLTWSSASYADAVVYAVPTNWRLQSYAGSATIDLWYTGSACPNGHISYPPTASVDEKNRFFAAVLTAQATGRAIGIYYDVASGCLVTSFYFGS